MNILLMSNTYKPLLGGLEKSVESFAVAYRKKGHRVIIVVPEYPGMQPEQDVIRIPAAQNFNGTDFSLQLPLPGVLQEALGDFHPHLVHSQHPFLIGDTALRLASKFNVPLVFTHHSLYEENVHYLPGSEEALKRFVIELSTGYANLADAVFAPSESVKDMIRARGVQSPIHVVPTGIEVKRFSRGAAGALRKRMRIPPEAFVIGHVGRLAPEKNLPFVAHAIAQFIKKHSHAHVLIVGEGPCEQNIRDIFAQAGLTDRLHLAGIFRDKELVDAYHAMDAFVFASQSETQGLVLDEAMASGVPVVAVDAPGVREVVQDQINGRLLAQENEDDFVSALEWVHQLTPAKLRKVKMACRKTAGLFSMDRSVQQALEIYSSLCIQGFARKSIEHSYWESKLRLMKAQWGLFKNLARAAGAMMGLMENKEGHKECEGVPIN